MLEARPLGDFRTDLIGFLDVVPGISRDKATSIVTDAEAFIRSRAEEGAKQAIPLIETKVKAAVRAETPKIEAAVRREAKKAVMPWVLGGLAASAVAGILGVLAFRRSGRR